MSNPISRHRHFRAVNLLTRLHDLLARLDQLPFRQKPVTRGFAGRARRTIAEAKLALGHPTPALPDSARDPAQIFAAAAYHFNAIDRQNRQHIRAVRAANMETYPRPQRQA